MFECLDVAVKHRGSTPSTHLVPGAMNVDPFSCSLFTPANLISHDRVENLSSAAGDRAEAIVPEKFKHFTHRQAKDSLRKVSNFNRRKCLNMKFWIKRAQTLQELKIPLSFQARMQSTNHMHFGYSLR